MNMINFLIINGNNIKYSKNHEIKLIVLKEKHKQMKIGEI